MKAKWAGECCECGEAFEAGASIVWTGSASHEACHAAMLAKEAAAEAE